MESENAAEAPTDLQNPLKRRRKDSHDPSIGRRKSACQTCRLRKIKCDQKRPQCSLCKASDSECVYLVEPPKQTLDSLGEILTQRFDHISQQLDDLYGTVKTNVSNESPSIQHPFAVLSPRSLNQPQPNHAVPEPSRDFSHIPPHRTTADTVLTWPIFDQRFSENVLIEPLLTEPHLYDQRSQYLQDLNADTFALTSSIEPFEEERIPVLVDVFLRNVHTKNPVLDVELLVSKGRELATKGLGWDAWSCIILLACALGCVAKPFGTWEKLPEDAIYASSPNSEKELQQGENCFVLACRRLGLLKMSILAAQCHFFAGVYLMYTLRPMLSWQHFHQAAITYQLYLKTNARLGEDFTILVDAATLSRATPSSKQSRLEQRLYWSCFKSETEFRVELPLPQSEIAEYEFPQLFPSPPSPPSFQNTSTFESTIVNGSHTSPPLLSPQSSRGLSTGETDSIRRHAKQLCHEEESWYYYLTEVALRRIGNRIINTFFTLPKSNWLNIEPYLDIAVEFEAQVSSWYANLPPAMQRYQTNSAIRMPRREADDGGKTDPVSRELSWATENRLLEMRSWLYQPFLYYLVHMKPPTQGSVSILSPIQRVRSVETSQLPEKSLDVLWTLIKRGIECNLTILDTRSLPHRHHGLWYDLRAICCSSLILTAIIKAGYAHLIPGGVGSLAGSPTALGAMRNAQGHSPSSFEELDPKVIGGKFRVVLNQLRLWSSESPDMTRHAEILESLIWETIV